jgi:hypothetical protein
MIPARRMRELLAKVEGGATLHLSLDTGLPAEFERITGLEVQTRARRREVGRAKLDGIPGSPEVPVGGSHRVQVKATRATVLGSEGDGNPIFSVAHYGKGRVYFLGTPMEMLLTRTPGSFHAPEALPCWSLYQHIAADAVAGRAVRKKHPMLGLTEHRLDERRRAVVVVNYSPHDVEERLEMKGDWHIEAVHYGQVEADGRCRVPAADGSVFTVRSCSGS